MSPCKDCKGRYIGCHGSCLKYYEWKNEREKLRRKRLVEYDAESFISDVKYRKKK